jgi:hypothetical protein
VVAYLPYWVADWYDPARDPYLTGQRLTDIVLFSVGVRRDGSLRLDEPGARFILGDAATRIIQAAHGEGIRVLVSFTSFSLEGNRRLFLEQPAMDRFVADAAALVRLRGFDGADIDVEHIRKIRFAKYAETAGRLREALRVDNPLARVTVATNANVSGAMMAAAALAAGVDRAFMMGYAYRGPTSNPVGSISPIVSADGLDLRESLDMYAAHGIPLEQVIVGLPAYGMTWATRGPEVRAARAPQRVSPRGTIFLFREVVTDPPPLDAVHDQDLVEGSARITWYEPERRSWFQTYYDTPATLRDKYLLAHELGLGGVGMWTLGYDGGLPGYPELVRDTFALPVVARASVAPAITETREVEVAALLYDGVAATDVVRLSNDGSTWGPWVDPVAGSGSETRLPWRLSIGPDGTREVFVQSMDAAGVKSAILTATTVLDRSAPAIEGLAVRELVPGVWALSLAVSDLTGVTSVEARWHLGNRGWGPWRAISAPGAAWAFGPDGAPVAVQVRAVDRLGHVAIGMAASRSQAPATPPPPAAGVGDAATSVTSVRAGRSTMDVNGMRISRNVSIETRNPASRRITPRSLPSW